MLGDHFYSSPRSALCLLPSIYANCPSSTHQGQLVAAKKTANAQLMPLPSDFDRENCV